MTHAGPENHREWPLVLRRYLGLSIALHLAWEFLQLPFYTLWSTGTLGQQVFAVIHCTLGDGMIAGLTLLAALALLATTRWPESGSRRVYLASLTLGVAYTVYSEWLNVVVRGSWAYSDLMPVVPLVGTGLAPLLQWIIVPTSALGLALGHAPWRDRKRSEQ